MSDEGAVIPVPFVRFVSGTAVYPPNILYESTFDILEKLREHSLEEAFRDVVREGLVGGQYTVLPESTWYAMLRDFLTYYSREFSEPEDLQKLAIEALKLMVERPHEKAWEILEGFVLDQVDELSGWSKSWVREDAERRNVFKGEDGNYYFRDRDGILVQIIGAKTLPETHLDFLTDAILRGFGPIRKIVNVFSLFAVSEDFTRNPDDYPKSLRLLIPEPRFGMLSPRWHRMQFHQVRTARWRPKDNLCDPEWLSEQLLARLTDTLDRDLWREHVEKYRERENKLDVDCPFEMDYVLDSNLIIGDEEEIYFQFEGKTFRWINGTPESRAVLSVGYKDMNNSDEAQEAVNRLLSFLVWSHRVPIRKMSGIGGPRRSLPLTWGPRMSGGLRVDPQYLLAEYKAGPSPRRSLALALYKEGRNSESVFYEFLSYWKILEVALPDKGTRWAWINTNVSRGGLERQRVQEIAAQASDIAEYLYNSGRCAIAHVFHQPTVDPDDREDNLRISKDVRLVEELARMVIDDGLVD